MYCLPIDDTCHLQSIQYEIVEKAKIETETPFFIDFGAFVLFDLGNNQIIMKEMNDGDRIRERTK